MKVARTAFVWMFLGIDFILGSLFGTKVIVNDNTAAIFLILPGILAVVAGMVGFISVYEGE